MLREEFFDIQGLDKHTFSYSLKQIKQKFTAIFNCFCFKKLVFHLGNHFEYLLELSFSQKFRFIF